MKNKKYDISWDRGPGKDYGRETVEARSKVEAMQIAYDRMKNEELKRDGRCRAVEAED